MRRPFSYSFAIILVGFLLLNALWQIAAVAFGMRALPPPLTVYASWSRAMESGIALHTAVSLQRVCAGIGISLGLGLLLGISMGHSKIFDRLLGPLLYLSYPIPKLALLPIILLLLGVGEASKISIIVLIVFFQQVIFIRDAVRAVPGEDYDMLDSLGASAFEKLRHIVLPATLPAIFSSLRVSIGIAFSALFFTETFGTDSGLGLFITDCQMRLDYTLMYFGIMALAFCAFVLFLAVDAAERILCVWKGSVD